MSKEAEHTMDNLTIEEMERLNTLGFIAITGNGHLVAVIEEEKAEEYEISRCENGY